MPSRGGTRAELSNTEARRRANGRWQLAKWGAKREGCLDFRGGGPGKSRVSGGVVGDVKEGKNSQ